MIKHCNTRITIQTAFFFCTVLCLIISINKPASAVLLTERQIILNSNDRTASLTIKNTTNEKSIYRFEWETFGFNAAGKFVKFENESDIPAGLNTIEPYLRYAPRRVIAEPGHIQNIRFLARRKKDMADGEYRSYFSLMPEELPQELDLDDSNADDIGVSVKSMVGWRIPVIMRHGETTLAASYKNAEIKPADKTDSYGTIHYTVAREGNRSFIGYTELDCDDQKNYLETPMPLRIYTESAERDSFFDLKKPIENCKTLTLRLIAGETDPEYADKTIAEYKLR